MRKRELRNLESTKKMQIESLKYRSVKGKKKGLKSGKITKRKN